VAIKGINPGCAGIWHHCHVGFIDRFPTSNGGTIKCQPTFEGLFFDHVRGHRQVLPLSVQIGEFEVDELNAFVFDLAEDFLGRFAHDEVVAWQGKTP
jgi:hypothetical protein